MHRPASCNWPSLTNEIFSLTPVDMKINCWHKGLAFYYARILDLWPCESTILVHYNDEIMDAMASQTTSLTIVYLIVYSGADQTKHQSSASLAFVRGTHRGPVNSPYKWPVTRTRFSFDDVIIFDIWTCTVVQEIADNAKYGHNLLGQCWLYPHLWPLLLTWFNFNPSMDN